FLARPPPRTEHEASLRPPISAGSLPGLWVGTLQFLRVIPKSRANAGLNLCPGSGVAGLMLSKYTERAAACDITARAVHFADFNRRLNRCVNVEALEGDLYRDRKSTRLNSSHEWISYAVFCLKKKKNSNTKVEE